jgi:hypothetical protein
MKRSHRAAVLALLGAMSFVVAGHAERVAISRAPKLPDGPRLPPQTVADAEVDAASLPKIAIPPVPADTEQPEHKELVVEPGLQIGTPGEVERWRLRSDVSTSFRLAPVGVTLAGLQVGGRAGQPLAEATMVTCQRSTPRPFVPVRWETFSAPVDGDATWTIHSGWIDTRVCKTTAFTTTVLHPRRVLSSSEQSIAFAARDEDGIWILFPRAEATTAQAVGGKAVIVNGALPRAHLPLGRGISASLAASLDPRKAGDFIGAAAGQLERPPLAKTSLTFRADAAQTVGEAEPTIVVRLLVSPG